MDSRIIRSQYEVYYDEAAKWIVRGILMCAPHSIRRQYEESILPLFLGNIGVSDSFVCEMISQEEINLLHVFIKNMLALNAPKRANQQEANEFVKHVIDFARKYFDDESSIDHPTFDYFKEDLSTITGNIASRHVLTEYRFEEQGEDVGSLEDRDIHYDQHFPEDLPELITKIFAEALLHPSNKKLEEISPDDLSSDEELNKFLEGECDLPFKNNQEEFKTMSQSSNSAGFFNNVIFKRLEEEKSEIRLEFSPLFAKKN